MVSENEDRTPYLNRHITFDEVANAIRKLKKGKAVGVDEIPSEVLYNESCIYFLYGLFNNCFETGIIPSSWNNSIINPIQKPNCTGVKLQSHCHVSRPTFYYVSET